MIPLASSKSYKWWADNAKCIIDSKIRQKLSSSPVVFVFCYIYAQKVVGSNTYAQVMGCHSVSVALGNWQCYVDSRCVWCYACHCALSMVPCIFFTRLLQVIYCCIIYILYNHFLHCLHMEYIYLFCNVLHKSVTKVSVLCTIYLVSASLCDLSLRCWK